MYTPFILIHICAAVIGLLSGFLAMALRKGSNWHGAAGTVFFVSMLIMSAFAVVIAQFMHPVGLNVVVGLLTFYLVSTAWRMARRREGTATAFDTGAMLFILGVAILGWTYGIQGALSANGRKDTVPAFIYFIFGSIALLCTISDLRMIRRGGAHGRQRILRHLWRMCLALAIATLSFYPGQARQFPKWLRDTNLLYTPHVLLIGGIALSRLRMRKPKRAAADEPDAAAHHAVAA